MRAYYESLKSKGQQISYIEYETDWKVLLKDRKWSMVRPFDRKLESILPKETVLVDSPSFLGGEIEKGERYLMARFYRKQRKRLGILMDGERPVGGKWSFDSDNRKKLPKGHQIPEIPKFSNPFIEEAKEYVNNRFPDNPGDTEDFIYPVTHSEAERSLVRFIEERLTGFGDYQDAIARDEDFLYHSLLSSSINIGLLTPDQVVRRVLDKEAPINSKEGFIRQIIGWREFILGIYILEGENQRNSNHFGHNRELPGSIYSADSGCLPVDIVLDRVIKNAYAHHIERLMILGNYMLLKGYHPDEIYRWFMEMFIDAYDWVMVPNVYGMSQYADGGLMATKPYISSSRYLLRMSDIPKGDWCGEWDEMFWDFIESNEDEFRSNPRMSLMVSQIHKRKMKNSKSN